LFGINDKNNGLSIKTKKLNLRPGYKKIILLTLYTRFVEMPKFTNDNNPFKNAHPLLEDRQKESAQVRAKYPNRCAVIVYTDDSNLQPLDKYKYLVPEDITLAQFMSIIRKKTKLNKEQAMWLYIDNTMPTTSSTIATLYQDHVDEDGFLYIKMVGENVFGSPPN
jgi:GABA(A) receptor-associated protein